MLLKREGVSVLLSEQNLHFARLISDRCYILEKGITQFAGTIAELDSRADLKEAYLAL